MCYFIAIIFIHDKNKKIYEEYIKAVKPIVESYGGKYLIRTENIITLQHNWKPDRLIVIEFPSRERLEACFSSEMYLNIKNKREQSVDSTAIIVEGIE